VAFRIGVEEEVVDPHHTDHALPENCAGHGAGGLRRGEPDRDQVGEPLRLAGRRLDDANATLAGD
jgi:hypothetical protein